LLLICYNLVNFNLKLLKITAFILNFLRSLLHLICKLRTQNFIKMMVEKLYAVIFFFVAAVSNILCQTFQQPNIGLKSHETLELRKVEVYPERTVVSLSVENRRTAGGTFCADKNIYIIYPDGTKLKLRNASGIPTCPDSYEFKMVGEKLYFTLEFSPLKPGTKWIDIVEECTSNCFWLYGITLDNELNNKVDEAFLLASKSDPAKTIMLFRKILETADGQNPGIKGALYINIINAAVEAGDRVEAAVWYKRLLSSNTPRLNEYVKALNDRGVRF
jgi:hypothetical protein